MLCIGCNQLACNLQPRLNNIEVTQQDLNEAPRYEAIDTFVIASDMPT